MRETRKQALIEIISPVTIMNVTFNDENKYLLNTIITMNN